MRSCVASSGAHAKMRRTLGAAGIYAHFEGHIFSATEVEHGKPAPDLFLHAAEQMEVPPGECLVVEDSVAGVRGAKAAGMTVFGHADLNPADTLRAAGADVAGSMLELRAYLKT